VRFIGVSLYSAAEIDDVLARDVVDGVQVCFGLLDPFPLLQRLAAVRTFRAGIIARSVLKHGFLSGKYAATSRFTDRNDQRSHWDQGQIQATAHAADRMRFLETDSRSLLAAAVRYPLAFPEVSTVVLSTKTREQATNNFLHCQNGDLTAGELARVRDVQASLGLLSVSWLARARETAQHIWGSLARRR
jgi:aryl-alcohol dehydrogenase-like predicted oxidoreductase